ncbi:long-chain fatty acid--CoA ligase [Actinomycetospora endophytica]|uniref:Long-chain fatty acid--CoA ligase n=1 Tax=Actinomycetospora endophytica TaxID=2291215 RepID=A0ABS8PIV0_9PSEU|nr:long-chain fatty acid--CoA ligase [Actinomycetospora endophytica]MCD2198190.1 long-chain fatty acid--CoA ligase [Actinomycetospora endophytica]
MNLAAHLVDQARDRGGAAALLVGDETITYDELSERAAAVAARLRAHGLAPGDRVGLVSANVPAFPVAFYGALMAGCAVVPMNPLLTGREIDYYLEDSSARAVVAAESVAGAARETAGARDLPVVELADSGQLDDSGQPAEEGPSVAERTDDDLAVVLYTSGTTGQPKGAMLTHANLTSNARTAAETLIRATPDDVIMGCLPLFHVFGLTCGLNAAVLSGASLALLPRFDAGRALQTISWHRVTVFEGVPTMYSAMMGVPDAGSHDTSSLRTCLSGGAAMPGEVLRGFEETFGCAILEGYGLSETSPIVSFNQPDQERRVGSIGTPVRGVEVRVVGEDGADVAPGEVGEIAVRGECLMAGYLDRPEATAESIPDGWFRTGDLARADDDGYLFIVDRKKQLIIRGGYNVYPREIEEVLYEHPAIAEAAVIGLKHPSLGEEVGAAVAIAPDAEFDPDAIRAFCKERVAPYKYPRHIWQVDELPKGPTGKIQHRDVVVPDDVVVG